MSLSGFAWVVFPYEPPTDSPYAAHCLRVPSGTRLRFLRRNAQWAVVENVATGQIGLFPIPFTREETVDRRARQSAAIVSAAVAHPTTSVPPPLEESSIAEDATDVVSVSGSSANDSHASWNSAERREKSSAETGGTKRSFDKGDPRESECPATRRNNSNSSDDNREDNGELCAVSFTPVHPMCGTAQPTDDTAAPLFQRVRTVTNPHPEPLLSRADAHTNDSHSCPFFDSLLGNRSLPTYGADRCGTKEEYEEELIAQSCRRLHGHHCTKENPPSTCSTSNNEITAEQQELRKEYNKLCAELAWLSHTSALVESELRTHAEAKEAKETQRRAEQQSAMKQLRAVRTALERRRAEVKEMKRLARRLCTVLRRGGGDEICEESGLSTSPEPREGRSDEELSERLHSTMEAAPPHDEDVDENSHVCRSDVSEKEEEEEREEMEPSELELAQDTAAAAEVRNLLTCIATEEDTLRNYAEQEHILCSRNERTQRLLGALEKESHALELSEKALDAVLKPDDFTILSGDTVEVVVAEGFVWPETLEGLTEEEREATANYQRLVRKYEGKLAQWQREKAEEPENAATLSKLHEILEGGDAAVQKVKEETEELRLYIEKYTPLVASVKEQLQVSQRLFEQQRSRLDEARAAFKAATGEHKNIEDSIKYEEQQ